MANTIRIDNTALLDLGTSDVITEQVSYKKKNSLQYKGTLSNMTKKSGSGFLSTTGKNFQVNNHTITADDKTYSFSGPFIENNNFINSNYCIAATSGQTSDGKFHTMWIEQAPGANAVVKTTNGSFVMDLGWRFEKVTGYTIGDRAAFIGIRYDSGTSSYRIVADYFTSFSNTSRSEQLLVQLPSNVTGNLQYLKDITVGMPNSRIIAIGIDSTTMPSRYTYVYRLPAPAQGTYSYIYNTLTFNLVDTIHGFGCVSEDGSLLTGEPVPFLVKQKLYTEDSENNQATNYSRWIKLNDNFEYDAWRGVSSGHWIFNQNADEANSYFSYDNSVHQDYEHTVLSNGVWQLERLNARSAIGNFRKADGTVDSTTDKWIDLVHALGETTTTSTSPTTQPGSQKDVLKVAITRLGPEAAAGVTDGYSYQLFYACALKLSTDALVGNTYVRGKIYCKDAQTAAELKGWSTSSITDNWTPQQCTKIGFIDYYNPIGQIGSGANAADGLQLFPHWRFFFNLADDRGKTWDYGRGWSRFCYDSFFIRDTDIGYQIMEEPMQIVTITSDSVDYQAADMVLAENIWPLTSYSTYSANNTTPISYDSSNGTLTDYTSGTYNVLISEDKFYLGKWGHRNYSPNIWSTDTMLLRCHPIKSAELNSASWYWGHHMGSLEITPISLFPFAIHYENNKKYSTSVLYYDNMPIGVSVNNTLVFTPRDLTGSYKNYSINNASTNASESITIWDNNTIQAVLINDTAPVTVTKMADYIFKTNSLQGSNNVFSETHQGAINVATAFIPYVMNSRLSTDYRNNWYQMPFDGNSYGTNNIYYYGAGINPNLDPEEISTSFLLPAITLPFFSNTADLMTLQSLVIQQRNGLITAVIDGVPSDSTVDQYWSFSQYSTDCTYKVSLDAQGNKTYDAEKEGNSWWPDAQTTIYPIGIASKTYGENYISATVDTGNNYVSRFYNQNNKTFLVYNNASQVYYGSEIFTIQSGNYYFDGQGIYYLGSQNDYSQNIFTAYAIGMKFLANSSSEAYFYSEWDRCLYLFTASNTLQKSISLADCGNVVDAIYSSAEQALYILFDDNRVYVKTQIDDAFIENVNASSLQSTEVGCEFIGNNAYEIYNPYRWSGMLDFELETEWIGNPDVVSSFNYADILFYSDSNESVSATIELLSLNGATVKTVTKPVNITPSMWKNQLYRERIVPAEPIGNALKLRIRSTGKVRVMNMTVNAVKKSDVPSAPRAGRV